MTRTMALLNVVLLAGTLQAQNILVDINADGTDRNATTADFEAAMGLTAGALTGNPVLYFPNNNPPGGAYTQTVGGVTVALNNITSDADGWFGAGANNNLLDDGLYIRGTTSAPSAQGTLSGLSLDPNTSYDLYLFAGRSQGHETTFTFDIDNVVDPSSGVAIHTNVPVVNGDNTLGTAVYSFATDFGPAPSQLVFDIDGLQNSNGNQDAVFSGFALVNNGPAVIPEPSSILVWSILGLVAAGFAWRKWR